MYTYIYIFTSSLPRSCFCTGGAMDEGDRRLAGRTGGRLLLLWLILLPLLWLNSLLVLMVCVRCFVLVCLFC